MDAYEPTPEEIQALVDGELPPEAAARVRSALLSSERALAELEDCLQVAALGHALREAAVEPALESAPAPVVPISRPALWRRRKAVIALSSASLAAAAAAVFLWGVMAGGDGAPGTDAGEAFALALAPRRSIEARLSWPSADRHRPYDTARAAGGERSAETLSFELLGRVEKLGDPRAVTAAHVLLGNAAQSAAALAAAGHSPDVDSDRAAIALVEGKPEDALLAAAAALEAAPAHVQASWNRALALERLGMPLTAADTFATVASRHEPGWSQEATERASELRARFERRQADWKSASAAGQSLVSGGHVDDQTVAAFPGLIRQAFYDAVRAAPSAERVRALRPLADALDAHFGGGTLTAHVDRVARADFRRRAPLAARYAELARHEMTDRTRVQALLADLRAARQEDMLLGALAHGGTTPGRPDAASLGEYAALARASGDPWLELQADDHRGWMALTKSDMSVAQTILDSAAQRCEGDAFDYLCLDVFRLLTYANVTMHRTGAAQRTLERARRLAQVTGSVAREKDLLWYSHLIAALRDSTTGSLIALSVAFIDERNRRDATCAEVRTGHEWIAMALINQNRLGDAHREMARDTGRCDAPFTANRAFVLAHLLRSGADDASVLALRREIAALRASEQTGPGRRAFLDHSEGRLLIDRAPAEGHALLRRAIAAASVLPAEDIDAIKARSYSYSVLIEDAAARGTSAEALDLLAEERGVPSPARCALGASLETSAMVAAAVFVARGADGAAIGGRFALAPGEAPGTRPIPADIRSALAGCDQVDVFARQPYYGRPGLLPRDMAWQFRTGAPVRKAPTRPGQQIVVANIDPPTGLDLAPLSPLAAAPGAVLIEGAGATPARVLAAAADASFLEIHAHGLLGADDSETSLLVLAPDGDGRYALGAAEIRRARLRGAPVVVLAACHGSAIGGRFHSTWGLADAFAEAGARAVIASPDPIRDAGAAAFFAALRARIAAGQPPVMALREERLARTEASERSWVDRLVIFR